MRIKTAITIIFLFVCFFLLVPNLYAQTTNNVVVDANINTDFYSTVNVNPDTVEIYQPSTVEIRVLSPSGQGISGREIAIVSPGLVITQPLALTNATGRSSGLVHSTTTGTYTVCAKDTTYDFDIYIQNCSTLYVVPLPIPNMLPEPQYTKGLSNLVLWQSLGGNYKYTVQVSEYSDFRTVKGDSGVISNTSFEFTNLVNGKMYFYRVRAQNIYGGVSEWSNSVYSVQDAQAPNIEFLSISSLEENTVVDWESGFNVVMTFRVTDNLQLSTTTFLCINSLGDIYSCTSNYSRVGDILTVNVRLGELERISGMYLFDRYEFCVEATDQATNVNRVCNIFLDIPPEEIDEEIPPPVTPKPPAVGRLEKALEDLNVMLDDTIGKLESGDLEKITTATSIVTATSAIAIVAGSLGSLPYFFMQLLLNLLSLIGFRKGSKPVGYVYDSVTKEPISQAIVRIFNEQGSMVWSDVTDGKGYFNARLKEGKYRIEGRASRYTFPSTVVFGKEDYPVTNVYHGEVFVVTHSCEINYAIPLDPQEESKLRLWFELFWGRVKFVVNILMVVLFLGGIIFAFYTYYNYPSTLTLFVLLLFVPTFFFILRGIFTKKGKYGVVRDINDERLEGIVVGIREAEFDKIVAKRVTDSHGRYRFMANEGRYYIEILETGYKVDNIEGGNEVVSDREVLITRDITLSLLSKKA